MENPSFLKNSNLGQAWLVILLSLIFGVSLAGVEITLGPRIEENKIRETMEKVPVVILGHDRAEKIKASGEHLDIQTKTIRTGPKKRAKFYTVYQAFFNDQTLAGLVVKASAQGYADKIELLLGIDNSIKKVTGIFILDQKETPGLGNKIVERDWLDQFSGRPFTAMPFVVVKEESDAAGEIDAVSGATISSRSVTGIVNNTIHQLKDELVLLKQKKEKRD
ncbi:MAG: FMN-binding protein [Thermodesulfobacteriota bacterium]|nr:FMN-binding protein [Thermodesulfobacteriota bacterium]